MIDKLRVQLDVKFDTEESKMGGAAEAEEDKLKY